MKILDTKTRLQNLNIQLPEPVAPIATYARYKKVGNIIHMSGLGSALADGQGIYGKVGRDLSLAQGVEAARMTALNMLAQANYVCEGDLNQIVQWIKLTGFVNCVDNFSQQAEVLDGASQLLQQVFGEAGMPVRAAVGVNALPMNIAVEIQADFEIWL